MGLGEGRGRGEEGLGEGRVMLVHTPIHMPCHSAPFTTYPTLSPICRYLRVGKVHR